MTDINTVIDQIKELSATMDSQRKADQEEIKRLGDIGQETRKKWDDMNDKMDELEGLKSGLEEVKTSLNRIAEGGHSGAPAEDRVEAYHKGVAGYIRKGEHFDAASYGDVEELKLLATDSNPDGGYWVMPDKSGRTVVVDYSSSPMRMIANVANTSKPFLEGVFDEDEPTSQVSGEREDRANNTNETPQIGIWRVNTHIYSTDLEVTESMLEDTDFDVEGWLMDKATDKLRRAQNTDFVKGSGANSARGFTTYGSAVPVNDIQPRNTIQQLDAAGANTFTINDWLKMEEQLKSSYLTSDAVYVAHRKTVGILRRLADSEGRPLWEPSIQAGQPSVFNGYRVVKMDDMDEPDPGADTFATDALPMGFGNFNRGYQIADRRGMRVIRDTLTRRPKIVFGFDERTGGDVVNFDCIKLLKIIA